MEFALASGAFRSRGEVRRALQQGGLSVDGERVTDAEAAIPPPTAGRYHILRVGKRRVLVGRLRDPRGV